MKNLVYSFSMLVLLVLAGCSHSEKLVDENKQAPSENNNSSAIEVLSDGNYIVDTDQSDLIWSGEMLAVKTHVGTIKAKSGFFNIQNGKISEAELVVDMSTIKSNEGIATLEKHLASADFFDTAKYPESKLLINSLESKGADNYTVKADLTIKGKTSPIEFQAIIKTIEDGKLEFSSDFEIDRTVWDVRYGSNKFFDNLGDKVIKDEIQYSISIKAKK